VGRRETFVIGDRTTERVVFEKGRVKSSSVAGTRKILTCLTWGGGRPLDGKGGNGRKCRRNAAINKEKITDATGVISRGASSW